MSKFLSYEDRLIIAQRLQENASFGEIGKDHNDGMKVTNLYIGQIKNKMGLEKRKNYNVGSGEGTTG